MNVALLTPALCRNYESFFCPWIKWLFSFNFLHFFKISRYLWICLKICFTWIICKYKILIWYSDSLRATSLLSYFGKCIGIKNVWLITRAWGNWMLCINVFYILGNRISNRQSFLWRMYGETLFMWEDFFLLIRFSLIWNFRWQMTLHKDKILTHLFLFVYLKSNACRLKHRRLN